MVARTRLAAFRLGVAVAALALCAPLLPAAAQDPPASDAGDDADAPIASLQQWDEALDELRRRAWEAYDSSNEAGEDIRGHTMESDWNQWLLRPETVARLDTLREQARAQALAGDEQGLHDSITAATPLIESEMGKLALLSVYWWGASAVAYHRELLRPWLARSTDAQSGSALDHLAATERRLADMLEAALADGSIDVALQTVDELTEARHAALVHYNEQRLELVEQLEDIPNRPPLPTRARAAPCPPPVPPQSEYPEPRLVRSEKSLQEVYPPLARRYEVEGIVTLRTTVSDAGCVLQVEVVGTSGAPALDEAALLWAESVGFAPALKQGKPAGGRVSFRVSFRLTD